MHTDPDPVAALAEAIRGLPGVCFVDHDEALPEVMGDFLFAVDFDRTEDGWSSLAAVTRACQEAGDRVDVMARDDQGQLGFCLRGFRGSDPGRIAAAISEAR